jgi:lipopolysaccharide biosynthesis regulator YciM
MDFDLQWLLWGLPLAFALGWLASRFDVRQWRREQRESPRAYFRGLNFLLNEQPDKAIDAFIQAVQQDPDTAELHFALGNLFRRRGEYQRAVRLHEHLLKRADLPRADHVRAQHALAQDFMKAGLFDRAEQAYQALEGTAYATEARLALLGLYERSRDWHRAIDVATKLEKSGAGSFATRLAHHWCEIALEADIRQQPDDAAAALESARATAPQAPRPLVLLGRRAAAAGQHAQALAYWSLLLPVHAGVFGLVASDYARSAMACAQQAHALALLQPLLVQHPSPELVEAIGRLDADASVQRQRITEMVRQQPGLSNALALLDRPAPLSTAEIDLIRRAVAIAAKPLQRYRCAACGFEAQQYFWQCPGCLGWDTYPPQRVEES